VSLSALRCQRFIFCRFGAIVDSAITLTRPGGNFHTQGSNAARTAAATCSIGMSRMQW